MINSVMLPLKKKRKKKRGYSVMLPLKEKKKKKRGVGGGVEGLFSNAAPKHLRSVMVSRKACFCNTDPANWRTMMISANA